MNLSDVQYPSLDSPYSRSFLADILILGLFLFAARYSYSVIHKKPSFLVMKSDTIMPEPQLFGLIKWLSGVPHCKPSSSFALNVVSSWKMNIFFSLRSAGGDSISSGNAFFTSSLGAPSLVRKPPATSWRRNFFLCLTTSSRSWPSMYTPFLLQIQAHVEISVPSLVRCVLGSLVPRCCLAEGDRLPSE